jgi:hypothetical protein
MPCRGEAKTPLTQFRSTDLRFGRVNSWNDRDGAKRVLSDVSPRDAEPHSHARPEDRDHRLYSQSQKIRAERLLVETSHRGRRRGSIPLARPLVI